MLSPLIHDPRWRAAWRLLFLALITAISWLAFSPHPPPSADLGWDKANHFAAFGSLTFTGLQCLRAGRRRVWLVMAGMLAFGILIELIQSQIPGRDADAQDVLADMLGATLGLAVHTVFTRWIVPARSRPGR
ncbi:MAG: VanZ family protein [Burkholderiaceae bacterium]